MTRPKSPDVGGQRNDEAIDQADADEDFNAKQNDDECREPDNRRKPALRAGCGHYDAPSLGNSAMALYRSIAWRSALDVSLAWMCLTPSATFTNG